MSETFNIPAKVLFRGLDNFFELLKEPGAHDWHPCAKSARVLTLVHTGPESPELPCAPGAGFPELLMLIRLISVSIDVIMTQ